MTAVARIVLDHSILGWEGCRSSQSVAAPNPIRPFPGPARLLHFAAILCSQRENQLNEALLILKNFEEGYCNFMVQSDAIL